MRRIGRREFIFYVQSQVPPTRHSSFAERVNWSTKSSVAIEHHWSFLSYCISFSSLSSMLFVVDRYPSVYCDTLSSKHSFHYCENIVLHICFRSTEGCLSVCSSTFHMVPLSHSAKSCSDEHFAVVCMVCICDM